MTEIIEPKETLAPQFKAVLMKYTKSARLDEMVADLIEVVERDAPKVQVPIPVEACRHITRLTKCEDGKKLICKKCGRIVPF
jgi:hypothetical protein